MSCSSESTCISFSCQWLYRLIYSDINTTSTLQLLYKRSRSVTDRRSSPVEWHERIVNFFSFDGFLWRQGKSWHRERKITRERERERERERDPAESSLRRCPEACKTLKVYNCLHAGSHRSPRVPKRKCCNSKTRWTPHRLLSIPKRSSPVFPL